MISLLCSLSRRSRTLLAVLIVCLLPAALPAETITIKNSTSATVKVLPSCKVRGKVVVGAPVTLKPGDSYNFTLPGDKSFVIIDPNMPNGPPLGQGVVMGGNSDTTLEIVPNSGKGPKVLLQ